MPPVVDVNDTLCLLVLRDNLITHIPAGYFKHFIKLEALFLNRNHLIRFPDVLPLNKTLSTLSLSFNCIQEIPRNMISSCSHLKYLSISVNKLQTLGVLVFNDENAIVKVAMLGNPWRCDSALAWLCNLDPGNYSIYGSVEIYPMFGRARFSDYTRLKCAQPDRYAGMMIHRLSMLTTTAYCVHVCHLIYLASISYTTDKIISANYYILSDFTWY